MVKPLAISAVLGITLLASAALANPATPTTTPAARQTITEVLHNFRSRIQQGVRAGTITQHEQARLRRHVTAFRHALQTRRQSHVALSPAERQRLRQQLQTISRQIYAARHGTVE
jgi:hypothetical protein